MSPQLGCILPKRQKVIVGTDADKKELHYTVSGNINGTVTVENSMEVPQKTTISTNIPFFLPVFFFLPGQLQSLPASTSALLIYSSSNRNMQQT